MFERHVRFPFIFLPNCIKIYSMHEVSACRCSDLVLLSFIYVLTARQREAYLQVVLISPSYPSQRGMPGKSAHILTLSMGTLVPTDRVLILSVRKPSVAQISAYQGLIAADRQNTLPPTGIAFLTARTKSVNSATSAVFVGECQSIESIKIAMSSEPCSILRTVLYSESVCRRNVSRDAHCEALSCSKPDFVR